MCALRLHRIPPGSFVVTCMRLRTWEAFPGTCSMIISKVWWRGVMQTIWCIGIPVLKVNSFCRCCELLVPLHLPQKMALKPSDSLHPLGDGNGSLLSPDNSPPPSYPESQNGGGRDRLPQASSSGF